MKVIQVGNLVDDSNINFKNPQRGRVFSTEGVSPCVHTKGGDFIKIIVYEDNKTETPQGEERN